jgi:hypothetical protein
LIDLWAQVGPFSEPVMQGTTDFRRQACFWQLGGPSWSFSAIKIIEVLPPALWREHFSLMFENVRRTLAQHVYARLVFSKAITSLKITPFRKIFFLENLSGI